MSVTDVLVNLVIDSSGSMANQAATVISGVNEVIESQKNQDGKCYLSLVTFSNRPEVAFSGVEVEEIDGFEDYYAGGMTALYDAMGAAIEGTDAWLNNHPEFDGKVVTMIWTDGGENASSYYSSHALNAMIEERQQLGQVFQFLGAGADGWANTNALSNIAPQTRAFISNDSAGYSTSFTQTANTVSALRSTGSYNYGG